MNKPYNYKAHPTHNNATTSSSFLEDDSSIESNTSQDNKVGKGPTAFSGGDHLTQYFYEGNKDKLEELNSSSLNRFTSKPNLRLSFDESVAPKGMLSRQKSQLKQQSNGRPPTHSRRLSWMSAATFDLSQPLINLVNIDELIGEKFKLLLKPPKFDRDDLLFSIHTFMSSIVDYIPSVKLDKTYQIFKDIRNLLKSVECIRLYGLLVHYAYWNIIHPASRNAINDVKNSEILKRKNSFADVDLTNLEYNNHRIGLLPEILEGRDDDEDEETGEKKGGRNSPGKGSGVNLTYDCDNISPKHRSHSFINFNHHNHNHNNSGNNVSWKKDSFLSSGEGSTPVIAKSIQEIDELFNNMAVTVEEEGDFGERIDSTASIHSNQSMNLTILPILRNENRTNVPFTNSKPTLTTDSNYEENTDIEGVFEGSLMEGGSAYASLSSETSLTAHEKEQLFIQLETCITTLFRSVS
jgi:hypothetical protein